MFIDSFRTIFRIISSNSTDIFQIVFTSLKISIIAIVIAALIGVFLGFVLALYNFKYKTKVVVVLNTLLSIPTVVVGLFLYGLLSRSGILGGFGLLYTQAAMIIGQAILILPIIITFVYSAIKSINPKIVKTAYTLGASKFQTSMLIFNEARYGIGLALIAAFGRAISEVGVSMMLGGNISGYTRNMTTAIALEHNKGNFALALALGIILLAITFGINIFFRHLQGLSRND